MIATTAAQSLAQGPFRLRASHLVFGVLALSVVLFWSTWASFISVWHNRVGYSHGYLVALISIALVARTRHRIANSVAVSVPAALLPVLLVSLAWVVAALSSIQIGQQLALPVLLWIACYAMCGWSVARLLIVPLAYLFTATPIWDVFNPVLQAMTVRAAESALLLFGIPAFIDGNLVVLPTGAFEIEGGCSGLHFFITSVSIAVLYDYLYVRGVVRSLAVAALAIGFAILANWIRVVTVIVAGHVTEMQHFLVTTDHYYFGWAVYALMLFPFLYVAGKIEAGNVSAPGPAGTNAATTTDNQPADKFSKPVILTTLVILVSASMMPVVKNFEPENRMLLVELPVPHNDWQRASLMTDRANWTPAYVGQNTEQIGRYTSGRREVVVYVNAYLTQEQGRELVGYSNRIQGDSQWQLGPVVKRGIDVRNGGQITVLDAAMEADRGLRRVVFYWYDIGGWPTANDFTAKLSYGLRRLVGSPVSGLIAISAECNVDCEDARIQLVAWLQDHWPAAGDETLSIQQMLQVTAVEAPDV